MHLIAPKLFIPFLLCFMILSGCDDNEIEQVDVNYNYEYFPLELGAKKYFAVDSTIWFETGDLTKVKTNFSGISSEETIDTMRLDTDLLAYVVEHHWKPDSTGIWDFSFRSLVYLEDNSIVEQIDNLKFVRMRFPLNSQQRWDESVFIDDLYYLSFGEGGSSNNFYANWEMTEVISMTNPHTVNGETFDQVSHLFMETSPENQNIYLGLDDKYAQNVGLIEQTRWMYFIACEGSETSPCPEITVPWDEKTEIGMKVTKTLLSYE
jgi:hypothetical protein